MDRSGHYPPLNSSTSTGLSGGVIAGISIGVVIGALLVAVSIYFYKKKKVKDKTRYEDPLPLPLQAGISVDKSVEFSHEELAKAANDFSIDHKIGQGGFGSVYYAELQGEPAVESWSGVAFEDDARLVFNVMYESSSDIPGLTVPFQGHQSVLAHNP